MLLMLLLHVCHQLGDFMVVLHLQRLQMLLVLLLQRMKLLLVHLG